MSSFQKLSHPFMQSLEYLWVKDLVYESMSQQVSVVTQTHKMKAKISECLGLITETRA